MIAPTDQTIEYIENQSKIPSRNTFLSKICDNQAQNIHLSQKMRQDDLLYLNVELTPAQQRAVQRRVAAGELHRVRAGIATPLPESEWPALFKREKARVLAALFPNAVVSFRSAFDGMVGSTIYLVAGYSREVDLPGLKIIISNGPGPVDGDTKIQGRELYFASRERMLLEASAPSQKDLGGAYSRRVSPQEIEERLISICDARGEAAFVAFRESTRRVAELLKAPKTRITELDHLMGAILGTRPDRKMSTLQGAGRARKYDAARLELFHKLVSHLRVNELPRLAEPTHSATSRTHFAFLESYFSNFIEGTEFDIGEARSIALDDKISALRPKDSHDIRGVYMQALNPAWRAREITELTGFESYLRERHSLMMAMRHEVLPGELKSQRNLAGNTTFVEPGLVVGTLREAGLLMHDVDAGLPRALLAMFIVVEVHPFNDGNGRLARLVMNSQLSANEEARIIIPTLYREPYLDCLRVLTREGDPTPFIKVMTDMQHWTAAFAYEELDHVILAMANCNAFEKSLVQSQLLWPQTDDEGDDPEDQTVASDRPA